MISTWSISPPTGAGTINSETGLFQAPSTIGSSQNVTVTATSTGNPAMNGTASIVLLPSMGMCTVSSTALAWGPASSSQTISLTNCPSGYSWTASASGASWVSLSVTSGTGNGAISVTAQALPGSTSRTGTITVDGVSVSVRQDPACANTFGNPVFGSPATTLNGTVLCSAGVPWTSSTGGASWLTLQPSSGSGSTGTQLHADANSGSSVRTATVTAASTSFTVTQHPPCSIATTALTIGAGVDPKTRALTCPTAAPWTATPSAAWLHVSPATGTGTATLTINADSNNSGGLRTGEVIVDGKTIPVTQAAASTVTIAPLTVTLSHGQQQQFTGYINGVPLTSSLTWSVVSGIGSFTSPGLYLAPATIPPGSSAVIMAQDAVGGGSATTTITLNAYSPPTSLSVSPTTGTNLNQVFTFAVDLPSGANLEVLDALISPSLTQFQNACSIRVQPIISLGYTIQLQENQGTGYILPIIAGQSATTENSQCRILGSGSSVTTNGTVVSVQLSVQFKPGFIGQMVTGARTQNSTGYVTQMAQLGTWNLSSNFASLPPSVQITSHSAGATVMGDVQVSGWALDNTTRAENAITDVQFYVDNVLQTGIAVNRNQTSTICGTYPGRPGCPNVGWSLTWNSRLFSNGAHTLKIVVTDGDNPPKTNYATLSVNVSNPPAVPITVQPASVFARMQRTGGYNPPAPQFTAYRGANVLSPVTWSISPTFSSGSITSSGVYTTPTLGQQAVGAAMTIKAANPADPTDFGSAIVRLMGALADGFGGQLGSLNYGQQTWALSSLGNVTYTLSPNLGTIAYYGLYTHNAAPGTFTPGTIVTITATKVGATNERETAYVRLW